VFAELLPGNALIKSVTTDIRAATACHDDREKKVTQDSDVINENLSYKCL
jgi:hypothetical protein